MHLALLALGCQGYLSLRNEELRIMEAVEFVDRHFCEVPRKRGTQEDAKSVFKPAEFFNPRDEL